MTPHQQLILHNPAAGQWGDCFRTCIACLLDMQPEDVPHVCEGGHPAGWYEKLNQWLAQFDLIYLEHELPDGIGSWLSAFSACKISIYHTMSGPSPRGKDFDHTVIGLNGMTAWDPHPYGTGLAGPPTQIGFLVRKCGALP